MPAGSLDLQNAGGLNPVFRSIDPQYPNGGALLAVTGGDDLIEEVGSLLVEG